ncbi:MAG: hypothetical protein ACOXZ9_04255 [Bacteroidales bacterium]|jgi:hypothetical protein
MLFKFDDITTFKVVVNSADVKKDNVTVADTNDTETNVGEKTEKRLTQKVKQEMKQEMKLKI